MAETPDNIEDRIAVWFASQIIDRKEVERAKSTVACRCKDCGIGFVSKEALALHLDISTCNRHLNSTDRRKRRSRKGANAAGNATDSSTR